MNSLAKIFKGLIIAVLGNVLITAVPAQSTTTATHVIIFQGDGMGPEHVKAGGMYTYGASGTLVFESFPRQTTMTHNNASNDTTDSAASATAMVTGVKVDNGVISVRLPGDGSEMVSMLELHKALGKRTGLVTESFITDASPAAHGSHSSNRGNVDDIFLDYMIQTQPDILLGGGGNGFNTGWALNKGYTLVTDRAGLLALDTEAQTRVAGSFGTGLIPADGMAGRDPNLPTLPEMTQQALAVLDNSPNGFYVFIEHEGIDEYSHENNIEGLVKSMLEFNSAVQQAIDWVNDPTNNSDWNNTLIVVLADHETGGLTVTETNPQIGVFPAVTWETTGHTQTPVPVYAQGKDAEQITGAQIDNTDIHTLLGPPCAANGTTVILTTGSDTWMESNNPTATHGSDAKLAIDSEPRDGALLRWDLSSIPNGSMINSATLTFNLPDANDQSASLYNFYACKRPWSEGTASWNNFDSGLTWDIAGAQGANTDYNPGVLACSPVYGTPPTQLSILLNTEGIAQLQRWVNGVDPNYGFVVFDYNEPNQDGLRFNTFNSSNPPKLLVHYSPPPITSGDFVFTVRTDQPGTSSNTQFTIPTTGGGYHYDVDLDNNATWDYTGVNGNTTCVYAVPGTYTIRIRGNFPRIYFNNQGDKEKILSVDQWGDGAWTSMRSAFHGCSHLMINASDAPDLSQVADMCRMFAGCASFNQPLGGWNTGQVTDMSYMFQSAASFNQDLSSWDTSQVTSMTRMFAECAAFNQPLGSWNTGQVTDMSWMFARCTSFNQPLGTWNTGNVVDMREMFYYAASFNQDISAWDTGKVANMTKMFSNCTAFNQPLGNWNTGQVTDMSWMFAGCQSFNQLLGRWDTGQVLDMSWMFAGCTSFNQPLGTWNTGKVINMTRMFAGCAAFNQPLGNWNTGQVTDMSYMFQSAASFNQELSSWDTSRVTSMTRMFAECAAFNQPLGNWNTGQVTDMSWMFARCTSFDQPLETWNTGNVVDMKEMFNYAASFNQDISAWDTGKVANMTKMFSNCTAFNQPLSNWDTVQVTDMSWMFAGCTSFNQPLGRWNTGQVTDMSWMFVGCASFNQPLGNWNTGKVINMTRMFAGCAAFNQPLGGWNTGQVTDMSYMFQSAALFDQDLSAWDTSQVTTMTRMFAECAALNQPLGNWNTGQVTDMSWMFARCTSFNQPLGTWNTGNVVDMREMFNYAIAFDQDVSAWNVENLIAANEMFANATLSPLNYDALLTGWNAQNLENNVTFNGGNSQYSSPLAQAARANMISTYHWTITDGGYLPSLPTTTPTPTPTSTPLYALALNLWTEKGVVMTSSETQTILAVSKYHSVSQPDVVLHYKVVKGGGGFQGNTETCVRTGLTGEPAAVQYTSGSEVFEISIIRISSINLEGQIFVPIVVLPRQAIGAKINMKKRIHFENTGFSSEREALLYAQDVLAQCHVMASHTPTQTPTPTPTASMTPTSTVTPWVASSEVVIYPNPAKEEVNFAYTISGQAKVTIDIFTIAGERVARVEEHVNGAQSQTRKTCWQAAAMAPGVYIARIVILDRNGKEVLKQVKKVALLK